VNFWKQSAANAVGTLAAAAVIYLIATLAGAVARNWTLIVVSLGLTLATIRLVFHIVQLREDEAETAAASEDLRRSTERLRRLLEQMRAEKDDPA
jgi:Na+/melibiose symporter-like transporter